MLRCESLGQEGIHNLPSSAEIWIDNETSLEYKSLLRLITVLCYKWGFEETNLSSEKSQKMAKERIAFILSRKSHRIIPCRVELFKFRQLSNSREVIRRHYGSLLSCLERQNLVWLNISIPQIFFFFSSFLSANGNASNFEEDVKSENVLLKNGEMGLKILGLPELLQGLTSPNPDWNICFRFFGVGILSGLN